MNTKIPPPQHTAVLEFGATKVTACLTGGTSQLMIGAPQIVPSHVSLGPEAAARQGLIHLAKNAEHLGIGPENIRLIAGTIPAPLDVRPDGSATVVELSNLEHRSWVGTDFAKTVRDLAAGGSIAKFHPDLRVYFDNDGKAQGAGILREFDPQIVRSSVFISLAVGSGVGGTVIVYGRIVRGTGLAGEPGNTLINFPAEATYWGGTRHPGNRRILESFAARVGLARQLEQILDKESRFTLHPLRKIELDAGEPGTVWQKRAGKVRTIAVDSLRQEKLDQHEGGLCLKLIDCQAEAIGIYLAPLVLMLQPHYIVIGGGLTDPSIVSPAFNDRFLVNVRKHLDANLPHKKFRSNSPWAYQLYIPRSGDAAAVNGIVDLARSFWCEG